MDRGTLMHYLKGTNFPAQKEEVASDAESQGAPQDLVRQIKNADTERFDSAEDVMQALQGPPTLPAPVGPPALVSLAIVSTGL